MTDYLLTLIVVLLVAILSKLIMIYNNLNGSDDGYESLSDMLGLLVVPAVFAVAVFFVFSGFGMIYEALVGWWK